MPAGGADAGDDRVEAVGPRHYDGLTEQGPADPLAPVVARDVDGVLDRCRVAGTWSVGRKRRKADHLAALVGDHHRVHARVGHHPGSLSSTERGTRSRVAVEPVTSRL